MAHEVSFTTALFQDMNGFLLVGAVGQVFLNLRFLYQWYYSEKQKQSILPTGFWWLSISGGVLVIIYSIYRRDPVLLLAQGMAIVPYTRNLILSTKGIREKLPTAYWLEHFFLTFIPKHFAESVL